MSIKGFQLIKAIEDYAPPRFAMENDRIGLQVGDPHALVKKVLVTLDVTEAVVDEAIQQGANWIIAHHAVIFRPLKEIRTDTAAGRILQKCLAHQLNLYIAHTNLDIAPNGVNDVLAERLGLAKIKPLFEYHAERLKKLVVFIPESHVEQVQQAIGQAGAGWIGNYSDCTFQVSGTGTFRPREGANPYIGTSGELERVAEVRLETIIEESKQQQIIHAMLKAHPYEEVAYDLYPLEQKGRTYGLGRIGELPAEMTLKQLIERVKEAYQLKHVRFVGDPQSSVKKVAIVGGAGGRFWQRVQRCQADVYITGDIDFHTAQDALAAGLHLIDPGHHIEHIVVDTVCKQLSQRIKEIEFVASTVDTNPFNFA